MKHHVTLAFALLLPSTIMAQQDPKTTTDTSSDPRDNQDVVVDLTSIGFDRVIGIHRADQTTEHRQPIYYHRPLLALLLNEESESIIWSSTPVSTGSVVDIRVLLTTPAFRSLCEDAIRRDDVERTVILATDGWNLDEVKVKQWPVRHIVVDCIDSITGDVLGYGQSDESLISSNSAIRLRINFPVKEYATFTSRLREGHVEFRFAYSYHAKQISTGSIEGRLEQRTKAQIVNAVRMNIEPGKPIFQHQINRLMNELKGRVFLTMRADNVKILPELQKTFESVAPIFQIERRLDISNIEDSGLSEQINKNLEALKKDIATIYDISFNESETEQRGRNNKSSTKFNAGIEWKVVNAGVNSANDIASQASETAKSDFGVTLTYNESEQSFVPTQIAVYKLRDGWDGEDINISIMQYVALDDENRYLVDTNVRLNYLAERIEEFTGGVVVERLYDGVPVGTMLPYYGNTLPRGYVWADGQAKWPLDAPWVPAELAGRAVPDMRGLVAAGVADFDASSKAFKRGIGTVQNSGTIDVAKGELHLSEPSYERAKSLTLVKGVKPGEDLIYVKLNHTFNRRTNRYEFATERTQLKSYGNFNKSTDKGRVISLGEETIPGRMTTNREVTGKVPLGGVMPKRQVCRWIIRVR